MKIKMIWSAIRWKDKWPFDIYFIWLPLCGHLFFQLMRQTLDTVSRGQRFLHSAAGLQVISFVNQMQS
jgi:hypothetical protein